MIVLSLLATWAWAAAISLDPMEHDIQKITSQNFDGVIGKFRDSSISALWLYNDDNHYDRKYLDDYNTVAKNLKGMVKVTAMDCAESSNSKFCANAKASLKAESDKPHVKIYPPFPMMEYDFEGDLAKLEKRLASGIPSNVEILNDTNYSEWITKDPTKPKVLLFSTKSTPPMILRALSSEIVFRRTVTFGLVPESDDTAEMRKKNKVKKFPTFITIRGSKAEIREEYKGEMVFDKLKEWVNLYSESGMGDKVHAGGAEGGDTMEESKPWLVQDIPELHSKSHQDICFKGEGLCVIYLNDGPTLDSKGTDMLTSLRDRFTSQLSGRGTKLKWMWMDLVTETAFKELFDVQTLPGVVVFNPHKRLRFTKQEEGIASEATISALLDKILGGDARFTMVKGQKLPSWAPREVKKAEKTEL